MSAGADVLIIGSSGYVGGFVGSALHDRGDRVVAPSRDDIPGLRGTFGTVFYCAGVTGDFASRPRDTLDAHVTSVMRLIESISCTSFVYLSSTRIYGTGPTNEDAALRIRPQEMSDFYNMTKLMGEAVVLQLLGERGRIARLSNVVGPSIPGTSFIGSLRDSIADGSPVSIAAGPSFARDYVDIRDVVRVLLRVPSGKARVYNVASGRNVTNNEIAKLIRRSGREVTIGADVGDPNTTIDTSRIQSEFGHTPTQPYAALSLALGLG